MLAKRYRRKKNYLYIQQELKVRKSYTLLNPNWPGTVRITKALDREKPHVVGGCRSTRE